MPSHKQHKAILDHEIDIVSLIGPLELDGIETYRGKMDHIVAILPRRHHLATRLRIKIEELAEERFMLSTESG